VILDGAGQAGTRSGHTCKVYLYCGDYPSVWLAVAGEVPFERLVALASQVGLLAEDRNSAVAMLCGCWWGLQRCSSNVL
jgi:hypothetical protein